MTTVTDRPKQDSALSGDNWQSVRQIRLMVGRLQNRKPNELLPESTWKRWRKDLNLTTRRLYSPQEVWLILTFAQRLLEGWTVEDFQRIYNIKSLEGQSKNEQQQGFYSQPQSQQQHRSSGYATPDPRFEWV